MTIHIFDIDRTKTPLIGIPTCFYLFPGDGWIEFQKVLIGFLIQSCD